MKKLGNILCAAVPPALMLALCPGAEASGNWQSYLPSATELGDDGRMSVLILIGLILVAMFVALAVVVRLGINGRISVCWAVLSVLFSTLALLLCVIGSFSGTLYTRVDGNPADTVRRFYDAILVEDYQTAYACLGNYDSLGLENPPSSENARMVYEALKDSYDYALSGEPRIDKVSAVQSVRFRFLKIAGIDNSVQDGTERNLQNAVKDNPKDLVYDDDNNFLPEVANKAYSDALAAVLRNSTSYYNSVMLDIKLEYRDSQWYIICDQAMMDALMGGTSH